MHSLEKIKLSIIWKYCKTFGETEMKAMHLCCTVSLTIRYFTWEWRNKINIHLRPALFLGNYGMMLLFGKYVLFFDFKIIISSLCLLIIFHPVSISHVSLTLTIEHYLVDASLTLTIVNTWLITLEPIGMCCTYFNAKWARIWVYTSLSSSLQRSRCCIVFKDDTMVGRRINSKCS